MERKQTSPSRKRLSLTDGSWRFFSFKLRKKTQAQFSHILSHWVCPGGTVKIKDLEDTLGLPFLYLPVSRAFYYLLIIPLPSHHIDTELGVILIAPRNAYWVVGNARLRVSNKGQEQTPSHMGMMVKYLMSSVKLDFYSNTGNTHWDAEQLVEPLPSIQEDLCLILGTASTRHDASGLQSQHLGDRSRGIRRSKSPSAR